MIPLDRDLQEVKNDIHDFGRITKRVLQYLPNVISNPQTKNDYTIYSSTIAGTIKYLRPINHTLFLINIEDFDANFNLLQSIFDKIKRGVDIIEVEKDIIDKTLYTIILSIGVGLDLLVDPNSARKHVGNRFEELIKVIFTDIGVANKKLFYKFHTKQRKEQKFISAKMI